jgi:DNA polymerase-3 subunit delta
VRRLRWDAFFEEIRSGNVRQAYLFTGPEEYVKREAVAKLREALLPAGLETLNEMNLEGAPAERIIEAAETLPVMSDKRIVVVRDWAPLLRGKSRDEENEVRRMGEWLEHPAESCALVFYIRGEIDARKKAADAVKKRCAHVTFDPLTDPEIRKWVTSRLKPDGKRMAADVVRHLVFTAGNDLTRLDGEVQKLVAYVGDRSEITQGDVEAIVSPSLEYGAFDMINRLFDGDAAGAYATLTQMLEGGTSRIGVLASITRQLRGMAFLKIAADSGERAKETEQALALNQYAARIMAQKSRNFDVHALVSLYEASIDADYAIKSGQAREQAALDALFIKISDAARGMLQPKGAGARQS